MFKFRPSIMARQAAGQECFNMENKALISYQKQARIHKRMKTFTLINKQILHEITTMTINSLDNSINNWEKHEEKQETDQGQ